MAVDEIVRQHSLGAPRARAQPKGVFSEGLIDGIKITTLLPLTFMNDSGKAIGDAMRYWRLEPKDVFVLHDELDLAPAIVKAKIGGGHAGHNGLRSIESHIGKNYWRVRLGVGHPGEKEKVASYVLRDFPKADKKWVSKTIEAVAKAIPLLLQGDSPAFTNQVGLLTKPNKPKKRQDGTSLSPGLREDK